VARDDDLIPRLKFRLTGFYDSARRVNPGNMRIRSGNAAVTRCGKSILIVEGAVVNPNQDIIWWEDVDRFFNDITSEGFIRGLSDPERPERGRFHRLVP